MKKKNLVIVESPTKAKTISKILGDNFSVVSSMGHIIDLPQKKLGVNIEKGFEPEYVIIPGKQKALASLKKEAKDKDVIYVATDPDREGEAIGWQLKERVFNKMKNVLRVTFYEITPAAVNEAFKKPRDFDAKMIEAQVGRRVLDRIVGYLLSPLLWKKIARGLSAGRVQSAALRLIIDREREIKNFNPKEYWEIEAELAKAQSNFIAKLDKIDNQKAEIKNKEEAERVCQEAKIEKFIVSQIKKSEKKRYPSAPFITSTMQQDAFNKLKFNANKTMFLAQQLYEGIDIGQDNPVSLITYMRTDSPRVSAEAINEVRDYISLSFGKDCLPEKPNYYKAKKLAQEAHEAIRPTFIARHPESLKSFLSLDQHKLYTLIYNRFLASQMKPAIYAVTSVGIAAGKYLFNASGSTLTFAGFLLAYKNNDGEDDSGNEKTEKNKMPLLKEGEALDLLKIIPSQHFTKPPARYSDSSLIKALDEDGVGRPSTYAPIIYTLILRDYARRIKGYFNPTELGFKVCDLLVEYFPKIVDIKFTALMEEELDEIEEGRLTKLKVLQDFYAPFKESLDFAQKNIKKEVIVSEEICEKCGKQMIIKWGRKGKFLSCSNFPECKFSKSITSGVKCPEPNCGGELIERRSRRGFFYGCSNFPKCRFVSRTLPEVPRTPDGCPGVTQGNPRKVEKMIDG
ncbi:MAG: type I DNA topoisomerase [Candidatus Omnitrophica bacterium CG08_land_8_20_14_0_20_41_16]|uniref:DNA topoisomerase 1 n=1 Tax=Candidatus Sherwoodlollariibacterium unditelluris TaxID=1974757 RepID=A0A2G9YL18_9BACT|nr:MAG: DNA topoisomerase I [Candidatus Omnitrophica bacterium CG23_combo_of_CG06-09_8_20_14_all_41_10]PIS33930.1 MAG: type I DNA topoisomerase [Candidatus Omnitrophica bacterium CG08_land_8_20_14_0_20_41_16]